MESNAAPAIVKKASDSRRSPVNVATIRQGVPMLVTSRVTILMSNGRPERAQPYPMPAQISTGRMTSMRRSSMTACYARTADR